MKEFLPLKLSFQKKKKPQAVSSFYQEEMIRKLIFSQNIRIKSNPKYYLDTHH